MDTPAEDGLEPILVSYKYGGHEYTDVIIPILEAREITDEAGVNHEYRNMRYIIVKDKPRERFARHWPVIRKVD